MKRQLWSLPVWLLLTMCWFLPTATLAAVTISDSIVYTSPAAPGPNEIVTIALTDPAALPLGSSLRWFVDGVERTSEQNATQITLTTKGLGERSKASLIITPATGPTRTVSVTIDPVRVDLIIAANNHTPNFYAGRSLPSASAPISARALVFGEDSGPYTYEWKVNGQRQRAGAGASNNLMVYTPSLDSALEISVAVLDRGGRLVGEAREQIQLRSPELYFYEANPLRGVLPRAIGAEYLFLNNEMTFRAEPYFFSGPQSAYSIAWSIDNDEVAGDANPLELSLMKTEESGTAEIGIKIINTSGYSEAANRSFRINY